MSTPAGGRRRAQRALRAALLGLSTAALAVAAHGVAGGGVPDTAVTAVLTALVGWAGTAAAERRGGWLSVFAVLAIGQASLHVLLTYIAHDHAGQAAAAVLPTPLMLGAHAVATAFATVLLRRADTAIAAVTAAVLHWTGLLVVVLGVRPAVRRAVVAEWATTPTVLEVLRRSLGRRGPPLVS